MVAGYLNMDNNLDLVFNYDLNGNIGVLLGDGIGNFTLHTQSVLLEMTTTRIL